MSGFFNEILRGLLTGGIDTALLWPTFAGSRFREASGHQSLKLSDSISPVMRKVGEGKSFFKTFYQHAKQAPFKTLQEAYQGAGTYFLTAYSWLVAAEFGVSHLAKIWGLNSISSTVLAGVIGAIIATPGEHYMVQGKSLREIFSQGFSNTFSSVKGLTPTIFRELTFSAVSVSGIQSIASHYIAALNTGEVTLLTNTAGAILCAPILALTQPTARIAATMQSNNIGLLATLKVLDKIGRAQMALLPKNTSKIKQWLAYINAAYCPGGVLRVGTLIGTGLIYGVMDIIYT